MIRFLQSFNFLWKCFFFILFAVSVLTFLLAYNLIGVEPFRRGFFCDDETIQYPYKEDTVSDTMVAVLFIVVPIIIVSCNYIQIVFVFEMMYVAYNKYKVIYALGSLCSVRNVRI